MSKIVERTLDVFEMFAAEKRPVSLTDMARLLDIPISSCHDLAQTLQTRGYIYETAPRAGFYPTRRLQSIAGVIAAHDSVVLRAEALLTEIRDELGETVTLAKATGMKVRYLLVLEPEHPIRFSVTVGSEIRSLYATSAGKAFLGTLPEAALKAHLKSVELKPMTAKTITSKSRLLADIAEAKERGWFVNREESLEGVVTVSSVFVWNTSVHVITVAGTFDRMEHKLKVAAQRVMAACRVLGESGT
jgi:DNA-binding IclR family transcriptional regulator